MQAETLHIICYYQFQIQMENYTGAKTHCRLAAAYWTTGERLPADARSAGAAEAWLNEGKHTRSKSEESKNRLIQDTLQTGSKQH